MPDGGSCTPIDPLSSGQRPDVTINFPAKDPAVRRALATVRHALRHYNLSDLTFGTYEIVLAEACNNIVEHAYQNSGNGVIALRAIFVDDALHVELVDHGEPMPNLKLPMKRVVSLDVPDEELPEGGFGWGLIRDMTEGLRYQRIAERNFLKFSIRASA